MTVCMHACVALRLCIRILFKYSVINKCLNTRWNMKIHKRFKQFEHSTHKNNRCKTKSLKQQQQQTTTAKKKKRTICQNPNVFINQSNFKHIFVVCRKSKREKNFASSLYFPNMSTKQLFIVG